MKITKTQLKKVDGLFRLPADIRANFHARSTLDDLRKAKEIARKLLRKRKRSTDWL